MLAGEEILKEIDATLDQLLHNAEVMKQYHSVKTRYEDEIASLQEAQESLLARIVFVDQFLDRDFEKKGLEELGFEEKIATIGRLNSEINNGMKQRWVKKARVHRNRKQLEA